MRITSNSYDNIIRSHSGTSSDLTIVLFLEVTFGDTASFCGFLNNMKTLQGEHEYAAGVHYLIGVLDNRQRDPVVA